MCHVCACACRVLMHACACAHVCCVPVHMCISVCLCAHVCACTFVCPSSRVFAETLLLPILTHSWADQSGHQDAPDCLERPRAGPLSCWLLRVKLGCWHPGKMRAIPGLRLRELMQMLFGTESVTGDNARLDGLWPWVHRTCVLGVATCSPGMATILPWAWPCISEAMSSQVDAVGEKVADAVVARQPSLPGSPTPICSSFRQQQ